MRRQASMSVEDQGSLLSRLRETFGTQAKMLRRDGTQSDYADVSWSLEGNWRNGTLGATGEATFKVEGTGEAIGMLFYSADGNVTQTLSARWATSWYSRDSTVTLRVTADDLRGL